MLGTIVPEERLASGILVLYVAVTDDESRALIMSYVDGNAVINGMHCIGKRTTRIIYYTHTCG